MISLFVNSEGGLTTAGYVLSIGVMVVCVLAGLALRHGGGAGLCDLSHQAL